MKHGNTKTDWFFSHDGGRYPSCACPHKHDSLSAATTCAKKEGVTQVREVRDGKAVADHPVS